MFPILDPTCGSGAFLFAALNILEPLYEACLERMQIFLDEDFVSINENYAEIFDRFRQILQQADCHPNRRYFILKSVTINISACYPFIVDALCIANI
ncbi:MAG: hypothetical protein ACFCU5_12515 [Pleurocapsa sp.]